MSGRFDYVRYDSISTEKQERFKKKFQELEVLGDELLEPGRPKSLFFTHLEEAYMWTGKAIRDEQVTIRETNPEHIAERTAQ